MIDGMMKWRMEEIIMKNIKKNVGSIATEDFVLRSLLPKKRFEKPPFKPF